MSRPEKTLTSELFPASGRLEKVPLPDAEIYLLSDIAMRRDHDAILRRLIAETPWCRENVTVWGKTYSQPRLIAWYGDLGASYTYSGITLDPLPWTDLLLELRTRVASVAAASFNSVLLNYYRDHRDSMGFHSDDEPELGERPAIASLSLGEERIFVLRHRTDKLVKPIRLKLASGSLLLMKGETQRYWKHGVLKQTRRCDPRINLTFRRIASERPASGPESV